MKDDLDLQAIKAATATYFEAGLSYGLSLLTAIALIVAGLTLARWAHRAIRTKLGRIKGFDETMIPFVAQMARYAIYVITAILVLSEFGVQTASIIAVLGAAGLAIGLALQGTLQNVASGIMLLVLRPYRVGDYIEGGGAAGTVDEIGLFMTRMTTPQNIFIAVPNSKLFGDTIVNYSRNPHRRMELVVGISYDDDIDKALDVLKRVVSGHKRVLKRPAPQVFVKALGESSVDLEIRAWARRAEFWDVYRELTRRVKYALDEAGITIPYPHRQIVVSGALPMAVEPGRRAA